MIAQPIDLRTDVNLEHGKEFFRGLGSFWAGRFEDRAVTEVVVSALQDKFNQAQIGLKEDIAVATALPGAPLHHVEEWYRVALYQAEMVAEQPGATPYQEANGVFGADAAWVFGRGTPTRWNWSVNPAIIDIPCLATAITNPEYLAHRSQGFHLDNGILGFHVNPFADLRFKVLMTPQGPAVHLWLRLSKWDHRKLARQYAVPLGIPGLPSTESYRELCEGAWQSRVQGPSNSALYKIISGATGVPLCRSEGEVVEVVTTAPNGDLVVVTDRDVYRFPGTHTCAVLVGDVLAEGQEFTRELRVRHPASMTSGQDDITVPPGFFNRAAGVQKGIRFPNARVPVTPGGLDAQGNREVSFRLHGDGRDLQAYRGAANAAKIYKAFDTRGPNARTMPSAAQIKAAVNPAIDLVARHTKPHLILLYGDPSKWPARPEQQALLFSQADKIVPPHGRLVFQPPTSSQSQSSQSYLSSNSSSFSNSKSTRSTRSSNSSSGSTSSRSSRSTRSTSSTATSASSVSTQSLSTWGTASGSSGSSASRSSQSPSSLSSQSQSSRSSVSLSSRSSGSSDSSSRSLSTRSSGSDLTSASSSQSPVSMSTDSSSTRRERSTSSYTQTFSSLSTANLRSTSSRSSERSTGSSASSQSQSSQSQSSQSQSSQSTRSHSSQSERSQSSISVSLVSPQSPSSQSPSSRSSRSDSSKSLSSASTSSSWMSQSNEPPPPPWRTNTSSSTAAMPLPKCGSALPYLAPWVSNPSRGSYTAVISGNSYVVRRFTNHGAASAAIRVRVGAIRQNITLNSYLNFFLGVSATDPCPGNAFVGLAYAAASTTYGGATTVAPGVTADTYSADFDYTVAAGSSLWLVMRAPGNLLTDLYNTNTGSRTGYHRFGWSYTAAQDFSLSSGSISHGSSESSASPMGTRSHQSTSNSSRSYRSLSTRSTGSSLSTIKQRSTSSFTLSFSSRSDLSPKSGSSGSSSSNSSSSWSTRSISSQSERSQSSKSDSTKSTFSVSFQSAVTASTQSGSSRSSRSDSSKSDSSQSDNSASSNSASSQSLSSQSPVSASSDTASTSILYGLPTCGKPLPFAGAVGSAWLDAQYYARDVHVIGAYSYVIRRFTNSGGSPVTVHVHFGTSAQPLGYLDGFYMPPEVHVASTDPCPGDAFTAIPGSSFTAPLFLSTGTSITIPNNSACRVAYGSWENPATPGASALVVPAGASRWVVMRLFTDLLAFNFRNGVGAGGAFRLYWDVT